MAVEIIPQAPRTRCHVCGRPVVDMICHHCGLAICSEDGPSLIPEGRTIENPEFTDLGLGDTAAGETGIHCEECIHHVRSYKWMLSPGTVVGMLGLIVLAVGVIAKVGVAIALGVLLTIVGIGLAGLSIFLQRTRYRQAVIDSRPPFPVIGKVREISATESIHGKIELSGEGRYTTEVEQLRGKITLPLFIEPRDQNRLDTYLEKYSLSSNDSVLFHAGFVVLRDAANVRFDDADDCMPGRVNTIALTGPVEDLTLPSHWTDRYIYTFSLNNNNGVMHLPVQIVPSFTLQQDRRAVELVLQIAPSAADLLGPSESASVEEFKLHAPQSLGRVEDVDPASTGRPAIEPGDSGENSYTQVIQWKRVNVVFEEGHARRSFYVRFENPIESTTVLTGRLHVRFENTLSGLDEIALFYPLGNERDEQVAVQKRTYVFVDFRLDLRGLRFQEMASSEERIARDGVVPNSQLVTALINAISAEGFYVKRVIENPPRTSKVGAHITNRYWDVAGRFYDGVYPIDYHLVLTGEEVYGFSDRSHTGKMQVDVSVQGTVTDEEMRSQVDYVRDRLVAIINDTLDEMPEIPIEEPLALEEAAFGEEDWEIPTTQVAPVQPSETGRVSALRARLDKLDDALLEGHISEERYEEMRARIEQELAKLVDEG